MSSFLFILLLHASLCWKFLFFMEIAILIQMAWNLYSRLWRSYMSCCSFLRIYYVLWYMVITLSIYLNKLIKAWKEFIWGWSWCFLVSLWCILTVGKLGFAQFQVWNINEMLFLYNSNVSGFSTISGALWIALGR